MSIFKWLFRSKGCGLVLTPVSWILFLQGASFKAVNNSPNTHILTCDKSVSPFSVKV